MCHSHVFRFRIWGRKGKGEVEFLLLRFSYSNQGFLVTYSFYAYIGSAPIKRLDITPWKKGARGEILNYEL